MSLDCQEGRPEQLYARLDSRLARHEQALESRLKYLESTLVWRIESRFIVAGYVAGIAVIFAIIIWKAG